MRKLCVNAVHLWAAVTCALLTDHITFGQQSPEKTEAIELVANGQFTEYPAEIPFRLLIAEVDLGALDGNNDYRCALTLENATSDPVVFREIRTGCACTMAMASKGEIEPGATCQLIAQFRSPGLQQESEFERKFLFFENATDDKPVGVVRLKARIRGNLFIGKEQRLFEYHLGQNNWDVPLVISAPVTVETVKVTISDSMAKEISSTVVLKADGSSVVRVSLDAQSDTEQLEGSILVEDPVVGVSDRLECSFCRWKPVELSPSFAYFKSHPKATGDPESSGKLAAWFIVNVRGDNKSPNSEDSTASVAVGQLTTDRLVPKSITFLFNDRPLVAESSELGEGKYRVLVYLDNDSASDYQSGDTIDAKIRYANVEYQFNIPFILSRNN